MSCNHRHKEKFVIVKICFVLIVIFYVSFCKIKICFQLEIRVMFVFNDFINCICLKLNFLCKK